MPIDAAGPVKGAISPIERVLPHLTSAASLADAADGAAARFVVADAAATVANAASASTAAIAIALLLIRTPPLDFTAPALLPPFVTKPRPTCCPHICDSPANRKGGTPRGCAWAQARRSRCSALSRAAGGSRNPAAVEWIGPPHGRRLPLSRCTRAPRTGGCGRELCWAGRSR